MDVRFSIQVGQRRGRPALACVQCRERKVRCNRTMPCSSCARSKSAICSYDQPSSREPSPALMSWGTAARSKSTAPFISAARPLISPRAAEDPLAEKPSPDIIRGNIIKDSTSDPVLPTVTSIQRAVVSKTRYYGPSHWMNTSVLFPRIFRILEKYATPAYTELHGLIANAKHHARQIKRSGTTIAPVSLGLQLPSKDIADTLSNAYLRTFENVYRILHVPSFQRDYDCFWDLGDRTDEVFIVKLQLCLAIGACFYDETFSFRPLAMQWIHEAQLWLAAPISEKSNMTISGLQIRCLLHLARETTGVNADLVWISSGALLQTAMYMGLHRDPANLPPMSTFQAELRRRLWATILELVLQSSIASGSRPLVSKDDFDTAPPANLDDEQLVESEHAIPVPEPSNVFTKTSFLIILRHVLDARLDIANLVNNFRTPPSYEDTLRHHATLAAACRDLSRAVNLYHKTNPRPSSFQTKLLDFLTRPFFIVLHMPFVEKALESPAYYFSRKTVVETSLKLYRSCCPAAANPTCSSWDHLDQPAQDDYTRLCICGSGPFRNIITQAQMLIGLEIISQLEEEEGTGDLSSSMGLVHVFRYMKGWTKQRLYAGETNLKGYMGIAALESNIDGLLQGLKDDEVEQSMAQSILESLREGNTVLESLADRSSWDTDSIQLGEIDAENMFWAWDNLVS